MRRAPLILLSLALLTPAHAQMPAGTGNQAAMLMRADSDGDGVVTLDELRSMRENIFSRMDRNNDGVLSEDDRRRSRSGNEERRQALMQAFDLDGDGILSADEFINGPTSFFTMADANRDGAVDRAEAEAAAEVARDAAAAAREAHQANSDEDGQEP